MANTSDYEHFVPAVPLNPHYRDSLKLILIENLDQLKDSFKKGYVMAWDTETTGLNPEESDIVGFSYSYDGITAYYCPVKHFDLALGKPALDLFYQALKDCKYQLLYNARFDIRMMEYSGYDMSFMYSKDPNTGSSQAKFFDVMNCVWLSDTNVLMPSLKASTLHFLGHQPPKFLETLGSEQNFQYVPAKQAYEYACFSEDTLIQTKHGLKQINELKSGDLIQTSVGYKKLISVLPQGNKRVIKVTTPEKTSFICTPDHLFAFSIGDDLFWVEARDLDKIPYYNFYRGGANLNKIEKLFNYDMVVNQPLSKFCSIEYLEEEIPVYDLSIEGEHNFKLQCGLIAHNCEDAANTFNLFKVTYKYYKESGLAAVMDNQCVYILGQLEKTPLNIDTEYLKKLRDDVFQYVQDTEKRIYAIAGHQFKIGSNRELTQVFLEQGIDTGERTKAGDMKTGIELLNLYLRNHPECELLNLLIEYKEKFKLYNSYLKTLVEIAEKQDTVPPRFSYKLQSVPTGRLSCLSGETLISTILGDIPIEELSLYEDGNEVFIDHKTTASFRTLYMGEKECVQLNLSNNKNVICTLDHKFLNIKTEWVEVKDLKVGDALISVLNNELKSTLITNIIPLKGKRPVYTLFVNHSRHQYLSNSLISHNCGKDAKNTYFAPINLQCLEENTIIKTERGNIPIKDVKENDLVWIGDKYVSCKPLGSKKEYCYKIKTLWDEIESSLEHQFLALNYQTYELEFHTLKECILNHYPLVRDPQSLGCSFDDIYHHQDYRSFYHLRKSLNLEEFKKYQYFYKDYKFDIIIDCSKEFWNSRIDPTWLIKTVYDLYVPVYNRFTANGYIVHNSIPKPKSIKCYGRKATQEEIDRHEDVLGWVFSPDHPEWSPGKVVEGMSDHLNVRKAFLPEHPEDGDYVVSCDMSGEELRVVTNLFKETSWSNVILSGGDLHHANSDAIFGKDNYTKETRKKAKCISGNSLIFTTEGIKKIEDICPKRVIGDPQPITLTVATPEGLCKATHFIYNGEKATKTLYFKDGTMLEATPDHIIQSNRTLKKIENLCVGDTVDCGTNLIEVENYQEIDLPFITGCRLPITEDIAYLLGAILGDGSLNKKNVKYMSIDLELINEIKRIVFSLNLSDREPYTENMYRKSKSRKIPVTYINCGSKRLLILLECLGINRNNHKELIVPEIIFRSPSSVRGRFIRGLFDTDGWVGDKDFTIGFCTKSLSFAQDIHYLLLSLGILNTISFSYNKVYQRNYYKIRIAQVSSQQFLDKVGFYNHKKRDRLARHLVGYNSIKPRIPKKEIVKIEDSKSEVFDLTIDNKSHLFYANGFIVHNCAAFGMLYGQEYQGFQRKFPDMTLDEAKEFMTKFKQAIPNITRGQQRMLQEAKRTGTFYTAFGRPRRVKHYLSSPNYRDRAFGERTIKNSPIQGTAADVLKLEFVRLWDYLFTQFPEIKYICTIHDEINFSVPRRLVRKVIPIIIRCMTVQLHNWLVPLDCSLSCGSTLGDQIPFKYNFDTKEFIPDWEEDIRKEKSEHIDDIEEVNEDVVKDDLIEEIDSKMFDL